MTAGWLRPVARGRRPGALPAIVAAAVIAVAGLGLSALAPTPTLAAPIKGPQITSILRADVPAQTVIGSKIAITAHLTTSAGAPIANAPVHVYLGPTLLPRADRTDGTGTVTLTIRATDLPAAGPVAVALRYLGTGTYRPSSLTATMAVQPATVRVATVPAVAGTHITLGSVVAATDTNGIATFKVPRVGAYSLTPGLDAPDATTRISFDRWGDGVTGRNRQLTVAGDVDLALGLVVAYHVGLSFVDPEGAAVDPSRIDSVTLVGSNGQSQTVTNYADIWLTAASSTAQQNGLAAVGNVYRIAEVSIAGSNVVNVGQQIWQPTPNGHLVVQVLLYSLTVTTSDALFGSAVQGPLDLVYPDGTVRTSQMGPSGSLSFDGLARGRYTLKLHASGLTAPTPVALSRSQQANMRIITTLDLAVGLGAGILAVVVLLLLGRRRQLAALLTRRPGRPAHPVGNGGQIAPASARPVESGSGSVGPVTNGTSALAGFATATALSHEGSRTIERSIAGVRRWATGPDESTAALRHAHPDPTLPDAPVRAMPEPAMATPEPAMAAALTTTPVAVDTAAVAGPREPDVAVAAAPPATDAVPPATAVVASVDVPTPPAVIASPRGRPSSDAGPRPASPPIRVGAADRARVLAVIESLAAANERLAEAAAELDAALRASRDRAADAATRMAASQIEEAWTLLHDGLTGPKSITDFAWEVEPFYERARDAAASALERPGDPVQWIRERELAEVLRMLPAVDARVAEIRRALDRAARRSRAGSAPGDHASSFGAG